MRRRIRQLKQFVDSHLATVHLCSSNIDTFSSEKLNGRQLDFDEQIHTAQDIKKAYVLTDTEASTPGFIDVNFVKQHKLFTIALIKSIKLRLVDDKLASNITRMTQVKVQLSDHIIELWCLVTPLGKFHLILDMFWMEQHDPHISFKNRIMIFNSDYCLKHCIHNYRSTTIHSAETRVFATAKKSKSEANIAEISVTAYLKMATRDSDNVILMWSETFEKLEQPESKNRYLISNSFIVDVATLFSEDIEKFFNKVKAKSPTIAQLKKKIFKKFHDLVNRWNSIETNKIPSHREWNHRIDLKSESTSSFKKIYELSRNQTLMMKKYIDDMLNKEFIRFSHFEYAVSILIVKKSEGKLRICVDYKALNALIIKNRNASFLIRDILARLCSVKIYSKFDIIAAFNEVRMRSGNEKKTAFLTRYDLYEYVVMSFGLCNASNIFQAFINNTFREYLNDFCSEYLDDIIVYNNTKEKHVKHVRKMLKRFENANLFLDIDKCEFFVISIKYLRLIITIENVKMDFKKMNVIVSWKPPRCVKDVQIFLDFVNFYRKFILKYSRLTVLLSKLTKTAEQRFAYSWNVNDSEKRAFQALKLIFITASILQHFNSDLKTWIEIDASNYVIAVVLFQREANGELHLVVFMFKKMSSTKCNYEIYDKEFLTIVRTFEKWRSECAKIFVKNSVKILTNHKNLKHFMSFKQLNRKQSRWTEFLIEFNFKIAYRSGIQDIKFDSLTRRSQNLPERHDDERHQYNHRTLLKTHHLKSGVRKAIAVTSALMNENKKTIISLVAMMYELSEKKLYANEKSIKESSASKFLEVDSSSEKSLEKSLDDQLIAQPDIMQRIETAYSSDVTLQRIMKIKRNNLRRVLSNIIKKDVRLELDDCEIKNELFWVKNKLYVFDKEKLHNAILKDIHESLSDEHAKRATIYDRLSKEYYWPHMTNTVARYIKVCIHCKRIKTYKKEKQKLFKSLPISKRYFQDIAIDFITSLSICVRHGRRYQHVMTVMNRLFKKKKFIALNSLKVEAIVQAFLEWIWREKNYFSSIVSNRKSQFISHFWKRLCERIETNFKLFTAWHSETDDLTERANQILKHYLRTYVNFNQDDWVDHLLIAEFEANSTKTSSTGIEPFLTTKKYLSRSGLELPTPVVETATQKKEMRNVDKFIAHNETLKKYLRDELKWAQTKMKEQTNRNKHFVSKFRINDMMMLNARHLIIIKSNRKLDYRNLNSFKIIRAIDNNAYELKLSEIMNEMFPVFHSWFLHFENNNLMSEQKDHEPASVATDAQEKLYDVEKILNSKIDKRMNDSNTKRKDCLCYKIRWMNWERNNQKFEWYRYTDIQVFNLLTNYHHKYSERAESHRTFVRPDDWTSSLWAKRRLLRQETQRVSNNQSRMYTSQSISSCRLVKSKLKRKRTKMIDSVLCLYKLNVHLRNSKALNWTFHDLQHVLIHKFHSRKSNKRSSRKDSQKLAICLKKE